MTRSTPFCPASVSRRRFLTTTAAAGGLAALTSNAFGAAFLGKADVILSGGTFHAMDPALGPVEALAVRGDRILAVGSADDIAALAGAGTEVIDTRGLTVTPGFIDAHSHPLMANEAVSVNVDFRSIPEVQAALRAKAAATPPGHWVQGHMYDDTKFAEGRPMNRADLDAVSTAHPVFIRHRGGHTAVVNSMAFAVAGVTLDTPDPEGGKYYREAGAFTGRIAEHALDTFLAAGNWPAVDRKANQENARLITRRMLSAGLTSTTDAYGETEEWQSYVDAYAAGELNCRVSFMPSGGIYEAMKAAGIRSGFGDEMLRVGAVKYGADGSVSERTMRMSTPFAGRPDDFGILTMDQAAIDAAVDDAVAHGFRIGIHANGDVTIDMVLKAYERVLANWPDENPRFRIEHCSLVNPGLLERIKATGTVPTPFYTYAHYHGEKWHEYGAEKMEWMFAHRSFLDYGIPVAPASDYTPGPYEPMMALQSLVTRKDPDGNVWGPSQRISVAEAMQVCTLNGAYASFEEHLKGSLTPGKLADIVVLAADPQRVDPDAIKDIAVVRTILGGRTAYEA
ncbi:MAG: amidohydrolase [Lysobacterales bacterium]|nr:MAG: amidohydrolase [Xanthomonadales bacterium]